MARKKTQAPKQVETLTHDEARRKNIPTAEYQSVVDDQTKAPKEVHYPRGGNGLEEEKANRNRDLDPQLVWRGKDEQDWSDLVVHAPPLYIQEKVHPKALIDDLRRQSVDSGQWSVDSESQLDLFADFNGIENEAAKTEFYQHDAHWTNRLILGDSLQVMASLAEREGLRGKVQCIYLDPPYGIKFNSNFQWSTTSRDVKDGKAEHITREPEQVKAFRDTWRDGIHSYLTYLRDRLTVCRDLLTDSGSIFVQIGDENVHRVRALMDEVFGDENFVNLITFQKTSSSTSGYLGGVADYLLWYGKRKELLKFHAPYYEKKLGGDAFQAYNKVRFPDGSITPLSSVNVDGNTDADVIRIDNITSQSMGRDKGEGAASWFPVEIRGRSILPSQKVRWKTNEAGMQRLLLAGRLYPSKNSLGYIRRLNDFSAAAFHHIWTDTLISGSALEKNYVVETLPLVIQRCMLMTTDPGDLVVDPTCGSGTTAYVAEQWGRRWITIDTSRVALALARARIMGARYPYYLLADSPEGQRKEAEITRSAPSSRPTHGDIRHGFVYQRVPHITLKSIANNAEIDVIWERFEEQLKPLREELTQHLPDRWLAGYRKKQKYDVEVPPEIQEWEIPREFPSDWPEAARPLHEKFWELRIARQKEIDASIAAKADFEYLYDKPYEDKSKVRVAGPFTVESLSPHRVLAVDENDELVDQVTEGRGAYGEEVGFVEMILDNLRTAGVQQAHKEDKIDFVSLVPWPGDLICAEGTIVASGQWIVDSKKGARSAHDQPSTNHNSLTTNEYRAAIFVGPEFGTVTRPDLVEAAREAADAGFDVLISCAFSYDAQCGELRKLGRLAILQARMNADLHMATDLKNTGKGNLFVIFGEPDITVVSEEWLVDSKGSRVAPYEIFKVVSGVDSLAEINGLDRERLQSDAAISCRREIWDYLADAACGKLDSGQRRRRTGKEYHGGVSSVAWRCAGLTGGTGDLCGAFAKARISERSDFQQLVERLRRDQQDAPRAGEITIHQPLATNHYAQLRIHGVDVFHPQTGEVRSDGPEGIACWFIDTDYNEESFFVRHAYFLGAGDPYKALKTSLKAEIDEEAWASLNSDTSRPFPKPASGRIAVKVINHLGDEVMKVFRV
ncbi:MAG: site-specific DNA-methyltransferase [Gammaproteobacteria bacterium]